LNINKFSIFGNEFYGPLFGGGYDICIFDSSNTNNNSYSNFGNSYNLPKSVVFGSNEAQNYLAGSKNFTTTEIEVFTIKTYN
jgi:hypothetical protein